MTAAPNFLGMPFGWSAIFSLFIILLGSGGVVGVWLKTRVDSARVSVDQSRVDQDGEEKLRSEMWKDIEALKLSKDQMSRRLTIAETKLVEQSVELGQHRFLLKLAIDELERVSPGNQVAKQARELLIDMQRTALPSAEEIGPLAEIMARMCRIAPPSDDKETE